MIAIYIEHLEKGVEVVYHLKCYKKFCLMAQRTKKKANPVKDILTAESDDTEHLERRHSY